MGNISDIRIGGILKGCLLLPFVIIAAIVGGAVRKVAMWWKRQ